MGEIQLPGRGGQKDRVPLSERQAKDTEVEALVKDVVEARFDSLARDKIARGDDVEIDFSANSHSQDRISLQVHHWPHDKITTSLNLTQGLTRGFSFTKGEVIISADTIYESGKLVQTRFFFREGAIRDPLATQRARELLTEEGILPKPGDTKIQSPPMP